MTGDVILSFKMRQMKLDGFVWVLKSDVDKLAKHHQQQVLKGNAIRDGLRADLARTNATLQVAVERLEHIFRNKGQFNPSEARRDTLAALFLLRGGKEK